MGRYEDTKDKIASTVTALSSQIIEEARQAADEVYKSRKKKPMTKEEYNGIVARQVFQKTRTLGSNLAATSKLMKERALEAGDEYRAKAINKSKDSVGFMIREVISKDLKSSDNLHRKG